MTENNEVVRLGEAVDRLNAKLAAKDAEIATLKACLAQREQSIIDAKKRELAEVDRDHARDLCEIIQLLGLDIATAEQDHITRAIKKLQAVGAPLSDSEILEIARQQTNSKAIDTMGDTFLRIGKAVASALATPAQPAAVSAPTDEPIVAFQKECAEATRALKASDFDLAARAAAPVSQPTKSTEGK